MNGNRAGLLLTSSRVAELLEVHSSTIKRWCDEGILPAERTEGGHRRIRFDDALSTGRSQGHSTFLDRFHPWERNVWLAISSIEDRGSFDRLHNLALSWLSAGETDRMGLLLYEAGRRPKIPFHRFLDEGIRGFMARVGEEWQKGRLAIGEEHMATQMVMEVLLRLRGSWDEVDLARIDSLDPPPVAIVGAMEGDHHALGAQSVRVLLEREGWKVYFLGADVPLEEFAEIQRSQGASLVCISFSPENNLPDLQRAVRVLGEFYRPQFPYALGLGGNVGEIPEGMVPEGPFLARSISRSAQEFLTWIRELDQEDHFEGPRRVA
jgi:excisionase family DNA binding protein